MGALLLTAGMTALVYAVIAGPKEGWTAAGTVLAVVVAVPALAGFAVWERRSDHPMVPMALFRDRNFSGSCFSIVLISFAGGSLMLMLTQYLQFVLGYTPLEAGLGLVPYAAASAVFNAVGAGLGQRVSNRLLLTSGLALMAVGFAVLAFVGPVDGYGTMVAGLVIMGMGVGVGGPAAYATLMGAVPPAHAGAGAALNDTVQQIGVALGVAALGSVLAGVYTAAMPRSAPAPAREAISGALALGDPALARAARESFVSALSFGMWAGVAACLAAVVVAGLVLRRPATVEAPEEARV